jgi:hypothetical protein
MLYACTVLVYPVRTDGVMTTTNAASIVSYYDNTNTILILINCMCVSYGINAHEMMLIQYSTV